MIKKEIPIDALRLGMYVVELDRPWLGTNFAFQGFPVTSTQEIDTLRACCKTVFVDPERDSWMAAKPHVAPLRGTAVYSQARPLESELPAAKQIYATCEATFRNMLDKLRVEGQVDMRLLNGAIASMTESIERNPDAMLLLNRLHEKDSYQLTRAMDTSILMATFGRFLQFPTDRLEILGLAGMLLDIGRDPVSAEAVVQRPLYVREPDENVRAHVVKSVEMIRAAAGLRKGVAEVVIQHHERQDAEGYPVSPALRSPSTARSPRSSTALRSSLRCGPTRASSRLRTRSTPCTRCAARFFTKPWWSSSSSASGFTRWGAQSSSTRARSGS
jgi:hypothetical protein